MGAGAGAAGVRLADNEKYEAAIGEKTGGLYEGLSRRGCGGGGRLRGCEEGLVAMRGEGYVVIVVGAGAGWRWAIFSRQGYDVGARATGGDYGGGEGGGGVLGVCGSCRGVVVRG